MPTQTISSLTLKCDKLNFLIPEEHVFGCNSQYILYNEKVKVWDKNKYLLNNENGFIVRPVRYKV